MNVSFIVLLNLCQNPFCDNVLVSRKDGHFYDFYQLVKLFIGVVIFYPIPSKSVHNCMCMSCMVSIFSYKLHRRITNISIASPKEEYFHLERFKKRKDEKLESFLKR